MNYRDGDPIDAKGFRRLFPKEVYELLVNISREGFSLTLVGGAVRDWLVTSELSHDLDFELRHTFEYDEKDWAFRINRLGERLREIYGHKVEFLSFSILRISWDGWPYDVELAPARKEIYNKQSDYGHSDFLAQLVSQAPYKETFKRRDFTINALGIELRSPETEDEFIFVDPFGGLEDLKNRVLKPCSEDFSKDPVRFCRAVRFHHRFDCDFGPEIVKEFSNFNLEQLSEYYFFREAFKGDFFQFVDTFFTLVEGHNVAISKKLKTISFLKGLGKYHLKLMNAEQVLLFLIYGVECSETQLKSFCELAKVRAGLISGHTQFKKTLIAFDGLTINEIKELIELNPLDFIKNETVERLLSFHQFMSKNSKEVLAPLGRINPSLYKTFLFLYKILPSSLEGKDLFEELIKDKAFQAKDRGKLMIYAHLLSHLKLP